MSYFDSDAETQVTIGDPVSGSGLAGIIIVGSNPAGTASLLNLSTDGSLKVTGSFSAQVDTKTAIVDPVTVTGSVSIDSQPITFKTVMSGTSGTTNNFTHVTMVPPPGLTNSRTVPKNGFTITNTDSGSIIFITAKSGSVTPQIIECVRLAPSERWSSEAEVTFTGVEFMTVFLTTVVTSSQPDWLISFTDNKI